MVMDKKMQKKMKKAHKKMHKHHKHGKVSAFWSLAGKGCHSEGLGRLGWVRGISSLTTWGSNCVALVNGFSSL